MDGQVRGLVFGALGEATTAERSLVQQLAKANQEVVSTQSRMHAPARSREGELVRLVGYVFRVLSFTAVHQQARRLLARIQLLGDGVSKAAKRRDLVVTPEEWSSEGEACLGCVTTPE